MRQIFLGEIERTSARPAMGASTPPPESESPAFSPSYGALACEAARGARTHKRDTTRPRTHFLSPNLTRVESSLDKESSTNERDLKTN